MPASLRPPNAGTRRKRRCRATRSPRLTAASPLPPTLRPARSSRLPRDLASALRAERASAGHAPLFRPEPAERRREWILGVRHARDDQAAWQWQDLQRVSRSVAPGAVGIGARQLDLLPLPFTETALALDEVAGLLPRRFDRAAPLSNHLPQLIRACACMQDQDSHWRDPNRMLARESSAPRLAACCKSLQGSEPPSSRSVHPGRLMSAHKGTRFLRPATGELRWNFHRCIRRALQLNWRISADACPAMLACLPSHAPRNEI